MDTKRHSDEDATVGVTLAQREREPTRPSRQAAEAQAGLDRYVVLEQVGAGGMGVVHRAYDPKLRREVAIKMLRFDRREGTGVPRAESRLVREAQAMAQLSHPNVLPVYDVEPVGELVYLVMEYVDGETLSRWMRRTRRPWREVVDRFVQAGRGLQGAHQAGIVHRDFKPSNVLLGNRGRVLVTDFGLARAHEEEDSPPAHWSSSDLESDTITESGEVVGTPAYMAPEQLRGEPVDARADQYAFCLALYEGLFGHRPFSARDPRLLLAAKERAEFSPDPAANVPTWLYRIVERGMAPDPADRFASMQELLDALEHDPAIARRRWAWLGGGALVGIVVVGSLLATSAEPAPCRDPDAVAAELWSEDARTRVREAILGTGKSYAVDTAERVVAGLDAYAHRWAEGHADACQATHVRREQSAEALDLRMACLQRHRAELEATVESLSQDVDAGRLQRASSLVSALPAPEGCADVVALRARGGASDPETAAELQALAERLARANVLLRAGRPDEAADLAQRVESSATALDEPILRGEALLLRGRVAAAGRDHPSAEEHFRRAFDDAIEARDPALAIDGATELINVVGVQLARTEEGMLWVDLAEAWLRDRDDDVRRVDLWLREGNLHQVAGRLDQARVAFGRAVERLELREGAFDLADAVERLGMALMALGELRQAEQQFERLLALRETLLGPIHPDVGRAHQAIGVAKYAAGELPPALPHFEQALSIYERAYGASHPRVAAILGNLGALRDDLGEHEEAREMFARALEILDAAEGTGSTELVGLLGNYAAALQAAGDHAAAVEQLRRAASLIEASHGPAHPEYVLLLTRIGEVQHEAGALAEAREVLEQADGLRQGLSADAGVVSAGAALALARVLTQPDERPRAVALLEQAVELYRVAGSPHDPSRGQALLALGSAQLELGEATAARVSLEAAIPLLTTPRIEASVLAEARFALARALVAERSDADTRLRARELASTARTVLSDELPAQQRIDRWLETLPE